MNCNHARENLVELLAPGFSTERSSPESQAHGVPGQADPALVAHVRECNACAQGLESLRKTMAMLDEWEAPEPSPYFLTRLRAHVKEEKEKAPAKSGVFAWLRRPMLAASMMAVLIAGGLVYRIAFVPPHDTGAVAEVQILEHNHDVLVKTDLIDEMTGGPSDDVIEE